MSRLLAVLAIVCAMTPALADEGMWMPQQIPDLAPRLRELGFQGDPQAFADLTGQPMNAVVSLGGCSASFVSPDGLIATNHHCVIGSLQYNSTPQRNLLRDGFLARTRAEELWIGPGSRVYVTVSVNEVTADLQARLAPGIGDRERFDATERWQKERIKACEKDGLRCQVASFFEGLRWFEIAQMEIKDVRIVYAPAEGIGVFGGETDNWQWPRHTGDFSFYRAYVGTDGRPAEFSKDNVPFRPKHYLKVSPRGASPGDLVIVAGYPGNTDRHEIAAKTRARVEWSLPNRIRRSQDQLAILDEVERGHPETAIAMAGRRQGLGNGLTNSKGVLEGLTRGGALTLKETREKDLAAWIAADPARAQKYGDVLPELNRLHAASVATRERDAALSTMSSASSLLGSAETLYRFAQELSKPDAERDPDFQERNWSRIRDRQDRLQRSIDLRADRALLRYALLGAARLDAAQRVAPLDAALGLAPGMSEDDAATRIDAALDRLYAGTRLHQKEFRVGLLQKPVADLAATKDTFVELAAALYPLQQQLRDDDRREKGALYRLMPRYMEALLAKQGGLVAPDANGTLRVTFGRVQGVHARDGLFYEPQTTLQGIVEKHRGEGEFDAPARELDAIRALRAGKKTPYFDAKLGDVPVNFLSSVDTTGGNSGSAVLNAKGELCGLLFDGTYDTVASDLVFDPVRTRSIQVDSRYVLWVMSEVDGAQHLVKEMGID